MPNIALDALHDDFLRCRTYGHAWDEYNPQPDEFSPFRSGWHLFLRCTRCGMTRADNILRIGVLDGRSYRRPEGYSLAGKVYKIDFRKENVPEA